MTEIVTTIAEQEPSVGTTESLAQLALQGAVSAAERGGFTLQADTEAELRALFDAAPSAPELPLSAHGLGCDSGRDDDGTPYHEYLRRHYRMVE